MSNAVSIKRTKQVMDFIYSVSDVVNKEKWVLRYDFEADSLSCSVEDLPDDVTIRYFGDEFAFYQTKDGAIKGIFIEYFRSNFMEHHKEASDIESLLEEKDEAAKSKGSNITLVTLRKSKKIISELEDAMQMALAGKLREVLC